MNRDAVPSSPLSESIQDLMEQQRQKGMMDKGMARLHALLKKDPSELLKRTEAQAMKQHRYHQKASVIRTKAAQYQTMEVFPFFALPTELRLAVYFELLVTDDRLVVTWRGPRKARKQQKEMHTAILRASKQCRDEGLTVLYGENIFDMEEICTRPLSVAKPFVSRISPKNASLIRIVIAEYSAAAEELHLLPRPPPSEASPAAPANPFAPVNPFSSPTSADKPPRSHPHLTLAFLNTFLSAFSIETSSLRVMAISIIPYGFDEAAQDLMSRQAKAVVDNMKARVQWLDVKNERERLGKLVEGLVEREGGLVKAEYWRDVDAALEFYWSAPYGGREWVMVRR